MRSRSRGLRAVRRLAEEAPGAKPILERLAPSIKAAESHSTPLPLSAATLEALKVAHIRKLSGIQSKLIAALVCATDGRTVRAVAEKLSDRLLGLAVAVVELLERRPDACVVVLSSGSHDAPAAFLKRLQSRLSDLSAGARAVSPTLLVNAGDRADAAARVTLSSTDAFGAIPEGSWSRCTHFVLLHEGGPDSDRPLRFPAAFRATACVKLVVVPHALHLEAPLVVSATEKRSTEKDAGSTPALHEVCCDGISRLQSLCVMLSQLATAQAAKVAVLVASREHASFLYDLLSSVQASGNGVPYDLFCDWETNQTDSAQAHDEFKAAAAGAVLISAFGFAESADFVIQYDSFPLATLTARWVECRNAARRLVVFVYPSEQRPLTAALEAAAVDVVRVEPPSSSRMGLVMGKLRSAVKRTFILSSKAFLAYKATLSIYAKLAPKSIFDVRALALEQVAAQFGLEETPFLDLRLKDNSFRPQVDIFPAASKRSRQLRRETMEKQANIPADVSDSDEEYWAEGAAKRARTEGV